MARAPRTTSTAAASTATRRAARTPAAPAVPRLVILPYGPSESVNSLAASLAEATAENGISVLRMKREGSRFRGREADLLVNWGSRSDAFNTGRGAARVLNTVEAVTNAASKRRAFDLMQAAGVSLVESTRDEATARAWFNAGDTVFARDEDSGHSGAGIRVMRNLPIAHTGAGTESIEVFGAFSPSPLYTKGAFIGEAHREYRVHVMKGQVTFIQQKKRRAEWETLETYSNIVRNYHTGWIYANEQTTPINSAAVYHAVKAVEALGLDFGAVDVITRGEDAKVLEVNTAPGLSGTNLATYTTNFKKFFLGEEITGIFAVPAADPLVALREAIEARAARDAERAAARSTVITRNFVKVLVIASNEESVGYFDVDLNAFILAGFDVPMEPSDVTVLADAI